MSWILGIDTSSAELSLGLLKDGEPFLSCSRYARNSHAEHITSAMNFLLESSGIEPADISYAGIAVGPGSFTGLRIGISFLKGFFLGSETPILPISSLHSMAKSFKIVDLSITAIMDGMQDRVFYARFKAEKDSLTRVTDDEIVSLQASEKRFEKKDTFLIDTLGYRKSSVPNYIKDYKYIYFTEKLSLQRGLACAYIAYKSLETKKEWKKAKDILPNYMQESYAELKAKKQSSELGIH